MCIAESRPCDIVSCFDAVRTHYMGDRFDTIALSWNLRRSEKYGDGLEMTNAYRSR